MNQPSLKQLISDPTCMDDYDPNAMSVAQARHFIGQFLTPVQATETIPIEQAWHRILATEVISNIDVPGHNNSAMDGFAFRHAEGQASLNIVGTALAGQAYMQAIPAGACIKIMTGAVLPAEVDTVVMQEHTTTADGRMSISQLPAKGSNVRLLGEDLKVGQTVLTAGKRLQAADMGLLASLGVATVSVYRRLKVAFFSTGDELVSVGQPLQTGQIYDSNRYSCRGMLQALDVVFSDLGNIRDDPHLLEQTLLQAAREHDVVITTGGVSVGEADYMKALLAKHGQVLFWKINMKPGRPLAYGKLGHAHYFGLPGNPVSTMVTFYQFVQQALRVLNGESLPPAVQLNVPCVETIKKGTGRTEFMRGILFEEEGVWKVKTTGAQGSGILSSMSQANCFIVLAAEQSSVSVGDFVTVQPFFGVL